MHLRSAAKNLRKSLKRREWNRHKRSVAKTYGKRVLAAVAAGDLVKAKGELAMTMKVLDKAAKARAIHPNAASRRKSALSRAVFALEKKSAGATRS
jgi:small subunit ribosomal protein S20